MLANWLCVIVLLAPVVCWGDSFSGRVVGVSDGDTVTVLVNGHDQYKIRIAGIDAPEKKQPFGQRAKALMSDMVYGRDVTVNWDKRDRFGRTVGVVLVSGQDAGKSMLLAGLAWHYKKYQGDQSQLDRERYSAAEGVARSERVGLWVDKDPVPPWEWRKQRRDKKL